MCGLWGHRVQTVEAEGGECGIKLRSESFYIKKPICSVQMHTSLIGFWEQLMVQRWLCSNDRKPRWGAGKGGNNSTLDLHVQVELRSSWRIFDDQQVHQGRGLLHISDRYLGHLCNL